MFKFREFFFNYNYDLINNTLVQKNSQSNSKPSMLDNNSSLLETTSTKQSKSLSTASSTSSQINSTLLKVEDFQFSTNELSTLSLIKNFNTKVWFITIKNSPSNILESDLSSESFYTLNIPSKLIEKELNSLSQNKIKKNTQLIPNNLNINSNLNLAKQDR
jgi:hypothetical protein